MFYIEFTSCTLDILEDRVFFVSGVYFARYRRFMRPHAFGLCVTTLFIVIMFYLKMFADVS